MELRDLGEYGFLLPENQVIPTGEELWAGVKVVAEQVILEHNETTINGSHRVRKWSGMFCLPIFTVMFVLIKF